MDIISDSEESANEEADMEKKIDKLLKTKIDDDIFQYCDSEIADTVRVICKYIILCIENYKIKSPCYHLNIWDWYDFYMQKGSSDFKVLNMASDMSDILAKQHIINEIKECVYLIFRQIEYNVYNYEEIIRGFINTRSEIQYERVADSIRKKIPYGFADVLFIVNSDKISPEALRNNTYSITKLWANLIKANKKMINMRCESTRCIYLVPSVENNYGLTFITNDRLDEKYTTELFE